MKNIEIIEVDYENPKHAKDIVFMMDVYASDIMGGGEKLSAHTKECLVSELANIGYAFSFLGYAGEDPVALANCFYGFSTFKSLPLVNVHDFVVLSAYRGQGVSQRLLQKIEKKAVENRCCKITLEVLEGNLVAQKAYTKFGFEAYELHPASGQALFWQKELASGRQE